jgi:hypothetical protein
MYAAAGHRGNELKAELSQRIDGEGISHDATEMLSERTLSSAYGTEKPRMGIIIEIQQTGDAKAGRLDWVGDP